MKIEIGTVAVILGLIGFYIRLITSQRRKTKEWEIEQQRAANRKKGRQGPASPPPFGAFSTNKWDWVIGALGFLAIVLGILLFRNYINLPAYQSAWWFPTTVGIYFFSWFFN